MTKSKSLIGTMALTLMLSVFSANAATYILGYGGKHIKTGGGIKVLKLKQKLLNQYGISVTNSMKLKKVILIAKSKHGHGKAALRVGNKMTPSKKIGGGPFKFHKPGGYKAIVFGNPKPNSKGVWQLYLKGNLKVKQVRLVVGKKMKKYVLYIGQKLKGNSTIPLKQKLRQQYGVNASAQGLKLVKASIIGKSKFGKGVVRLKVGNKFSAAQKLGGNPFTWFMKGKNDIDTFANPKPNSLGVWQFKLNGNFKIKKVVLYVK